MKNFDPKEIEVTELSYCECNICGNYFFIYELPMSLNDPKFCPYCGIDFEYLLEGENG